MSTEFEKHREQISKLGIEDEKIMECYSILKNEQSKIYKEKIVKFPIAEEARKKIDKGETINQNKELEDIKLKIIKAVDKGECSVYISNFRIMESTTRFLENQGYKVEVGGRYNEVNTFISW